MPGEGVDAHFLEWHPLQQISFSGRNSFPLISINLIPGRNSIIKGGTWKTSWCLYIYYCLLYSVCGWMSLPTRVSHIPGLPNIRPLPIEVLMPVEQSCLYNCLPPNNTTCSCCYRWKENTRQVGSATSDGESRDTFQLHCIIQGWQGPPEFHSFQMQCLISKC